MESNLLAK